MTQAVFDAAYYQANYPDYDRQNPPRKHRHYAGLIARHLPPHLPRRVHDVGCAFGAFLRSLGPGWDVCGSDPSEFAIARAQELCPHGDFRVGSATDLAPFPGRFGVVTAFDVIEHVPELEQVASAVKGQLADGGLFVFVVPVYDGLSGPIIRALDRDPTHVHKWPRRRWLDWAAEHFEVLEWSGTLRYLLPGVKYYVHLPTRIFRRHTPALTVVCRKRA